MNTRELVEQYSIENYGKENSLKGKRVLLRIDVNVSLGENNSVDPGEDWRIIKSYQTIKYLVQEGACVILMSHIGRSKDETLKPIVEYMSQEVQLGFIPSYDYELIENTVNNMQHGSVLMLENLRQHDGEKENNPEFLKPIIELCDLYVNDAFSVSHREHASVHAVTQLLPTYFGLQFVDEIRYLSKALKGDTKVTTLILGGAKFGTKLSLLKNMLPHVSYVLVGGALANLFLRERGFEIGESFVDEVDISDIVNNEKIILMVDCVDQDGDVLSIDEVREDDVILDIGHQTEELFEQVIATSDLILWNGPMGKYEDGFTSGSLAIAKSISHAPGFSLTGGGDTATVILEEGVADSFDFISTGGGAMLDFLVDGTLPAIDIVKQQHV
jgi:3-phosphoglycerate kinase